MPATSTLAGGSEEFDYYTSTDGGQTFSRTGQPLVFSGTENSGVLNSAVDGNTLWVVPASGAVIYKSTNAGTTWTSLSSPTLPANGTSFSGSGSNMTLVVSTTKCVTGKTDCTTGTAVYSSADSGEVWSMSS